MTDAGKSAARTAVNAGCDLDEETTASIDQLLDAHRELLALYAVCAVFEDLALRLGARAPGTDRRDH